MPDKTLSEVEDVFFLVRHYESSEKEVLYTIDVKCEKNIVLDKSLNNLMLKKGLTSIIESVNQISMEDKRVLYFLSLSDEQGEVGKTVLPDLVGVNSKGKEVTIKPTRFFARFPELFSNADLELISSSLKIVNNVKVEIVDGELINKYYLGETYSTTNTELYSKSNLYKSCMRYPQKNEAINIYSQNPDKVRMVVVLDSTGVVARALLWKTDQSIILMDRIYSVEEKYERYLLNLAATNGWAFKTKQSAGVTTRITYEGEERIIHLSVSLNLTGLKHYPYMDTFAYLVMDKNRKVVLKNVPVGQYYRVLDSQNGFFPNGKEFGEDFDFDDTLGVGDFWFDTSGKPVLIDEESKVLSFIYDKYNARGNMIPKNSFKFKTEEGLYTNSDKKCNFVDLYEKFYLSEVYHNDYLTECGLTVVPTKDGVSFITKNGYASNIMLDLAPGEIMNLLDRGYRLNVALKQSQVESYLESYYCNGFNLNDGFSPIYFLRVRKCDGDYLQAEFRAETPSVTEIVTSTDSLFKFFEVDKELFNNALMQLKKFFTPEIVAQYAGPKEESVITVDTRAMMA